LLIVFAILAYGVTLIPFADWTAAASDWVGEHAVAGPLAYFVFVAVAALLFLPGSVAIMIGGYLFGFGFGLLYAAIAVPVAAQCAFEAGRWFARRWVQAKIASNPRLHAIEAGLQAQAFLLVALTRLSLILPFNLLNYAYGATSVKARVHFLATAAGMLPAVGLYVYLGTLARDVRQILSGEAAPPDLGYWIVAAGLVVIAFVTWVIHRTATRTLEKHLGTEISQ
jgi:uncharacterized membrane protein YdjX (TVP38/TMEM64 family)